MSKELPALSAEFTYAGSRRHLENVTIEGATLIGMERRKSGKFSNRVKRFKIEEMEDLKYERQ